MPHIRLHRQAIRIIRGVLPLKKRKRDAPVSPYTRQTSKHAVPQRLQVVKQHDYPTRISKLAPLLEVSEDKVIAGSKTYHYFTLFNEIASVYDYMGAVGRIALQRSLVVSFNSGRAINQPVLSFCKSIFIFVVGQPLLFDQVRQDAEGRAIQLGARQGAHRAQATDHVNCDLAKEGAQSARRFNLLALS